ncbi:MAG: recombinase family protein [Acidobacteriota bacterium]|nr:recombinase family protein [Acidobacteriota bacterium]
MSPSPPRFIAYYRVSTDSQGESGLGLEAQRQAVRQFVTGDLAGEYTEVESGKRHTNRPQLAQALAECRKRKATLVIAKLDRLARNVYFISGLMESGVDFTAVDMPTANRLTIHILAAVAEHEREMISERTKAGLAAAKREIAANGFRVSRNSGLVYSKHGNPRLEEARAKALALNHSQRAATETSTLIADWRRAGKTYRAIANGLNRLNIPSPRSRQWHASTVRAKFILG